jgi:RNA polymerase sigma factor (sigma-70 family)
MSGDPTYTDYSSEDLLVIISFGEEELVARNAAFTQFVLRFREPLLKACELKCKYFGNDITDAADIVQNIFFQVLKHQTFDKAKSKIKDTEQAVLAWLRGILKAEFFKYYFPKKKFEIEDEIEIIYGAFQGGGYKLIDNKKYLGVQHQSIINALNTLTEKERAVYLTYREFSSIGEYLPRIVRQAMTEELGLTSSSLRVYHLRAKQKINQSLENK